MDRPVQSTDLTSWQQTHQIGEGNTNKKSLLQTVFGCCNYGAISTQNLPPRIERTIDSRQNSSEVDFTDANPRVTSACDGAGPSSSTAPTIKIQVLEIGAEKVRTEKTEGEAVRPTTPSQESLSLNIWVPQKFTPAYSKAQCFLTSSIAPLEIPVIDNAIFRINNLNIEELAVQLSENNTVRDFLTSDCITHILSKIDLIDSSPQEEYKANIQNQLSDIKLAILNNKDSKQKILALIYTTLAHPKIMSRTAGIEAIAALLIKNISKNMDTFLQKNGGNKLINILREHNQAQYKKMPAQQACSKIISSMGTEGSFLAKILLDLEGQDNEILYKKVKKYHASVTKKFNHLIETQTDKDKNSLALIYKILSHPSFIDNDDASQTTAMKEAISALLFSRLAKAFQTSLTVLMEEIKECEAISINNQFVHQVLYDNFPAYERLCINSKLDLKNVLPTLAENYENNNEGRIKQFHDITSHLLFHIANSVLTKTSREAHSEPLGDEYNNTIKILQDCLKSTLNT